MNRGRLPLGLERGDLGGVRERRMEGMWSGKGLELSLDSHLDTAMVGDP